jgi:hypothetical protein
MKIMPIDFPCEPGQTELFSTGGEFPRPPPAGFKFCFDPGELDPAEVKRIQRQEFQAGLLWAAAIAAALLLLTRLFSPR